MSSGAELLILQQSIRHYIEISQTRELAVHEKSEYQKLAAALVPALKRFAEAPSTATHSVAQTKNDTTARMPSKPLTTIMANATGKANIPVLDKSAVRLKKESSSQVVNKLDVAHRQKPTILGAKSTNRPQTDLSLTGSTVLNPKSNVNKKDDLTKGPTVLDPKANVNKKTQDGQTKRPAKRQRPLPANNQNESKKGHRKRTVTLGGSSDDDDDKENVDPRRPYSGRRRTTLEGDSVAVIRSQINPRPALANSRDSIVNILSGNRGHIERGSFTLTGTAPHFDHAIQPRPTINRAINTARVNAQSNPHTLSQESIHPLRLPSLHAPQPSQVQLQEPHQKILVHSLEASQQPHIPPQERLVSPRIQLRTVHDSSHVSSEAISHSRFMHHDELVRPPVEFEAQKPYTQPREATHDSLLKPQEAPSIPEFKLEFPTSTSLESHKEESGKHSQEPDVDSPFEVPPSVEDDDESLRDFEGLHEQTPEEPVIAERAKSNAQGLDAPSITDLADVPDSQCSESSQGSLQATLAVPMFLQNSLLEEVGESVPSGDDQEQVLPTESSKLVDGVWCFDEFKENILATVCSNLEEWIAVETKAQVQFWQLENKVPLSDCKWMKRVQLEKTSAATRIMFASDDSMAVVVDMINYTLLRVPLTNEAVPGDPPSLSSAFWKGAPFSQSCNSFVMEGQDNRKLIVAGSTSSGSICLVDVSTIHGSDNPCPSQTLIHVNTNEIASSIVQVKNSESLTVATFGETIVLWDLMSSSKPAAIIDLASILSSFRLTSSPQQQLKPVIVTATVPSNFLQTFNGGSQATSGTLPASQWPIFICLGVKSGASYHLENEYDQCALFIMNGSKIELVHKYRGTSSISSALASARFLACQTMTPGGKTASLQLWDICSSESVASMDLVVSAEAQNALSREPRRSWTPTKTASFLSSGSTLSPPPTSSDDEEEDTESVSTNVLPKSGRPVFKPEESMNLRSVAFLDRAAEVKFALHGLHRWAVIVKRVGHRSTIHVMDFGAMLH
ncbi:hypothetical protein EMPS_03152 [Entomortierella parvispora]|uniref:Uncharacterized protein n=1 Tax=Entomortierella parvispora TaxID=205924 RepID=A0A9P3H6U0_9FUNG|nr:hypothetical protein EMPS_03152 [Entomortierella parvispora]